jgi:hypothetical protein
VAAGDTLADGLAVGVADGVGAGAVGLPGGVACVADAVALAVWTAVVAVGGGGGAVPVGGGPAAVTVALGVAVGRRASAPPPHPIDNESSALSDTAARNRFITPKDARERAYAGPLAFATTIYAPHDTPRALVA